MPSSFDDIHHYHHGGSPPQPSPPKPNPKVLSAILKAIIMTAITTLFFLFLGVAAILLLLATAALHRHSGPSNSADGLSYDDLKRLPGFKMAKKSKREGEAVCAICIDGIKQGEWCRKLIGCGHVFHKKCVDPWLGKVSTCPNCRTSVRLQSESLIEDRPLWGFGWTNESRLW